MDLFDRLSLALPRLRLLREEPLAAHTSFRIGGPAEVMAFPSSLAELQALLRLSAQEVSACVCSAQARIFWRRTAACAGLVS